MGCTVAAASAQRPVIQNITTELTSHSVHDSSMHYLSGEVTMSGVMADPRTSPMGLDIPTRMVARVRCSSPNHSCDTLVGMHEMNGQAMPVIACMAEEENYRVSHQVLDRVG